VRGFSLVHQGGTTLKGRTTTLDAGGITSPYVVRGFSLVHQGGTTLKGRTTINHPPYLKGDKAAFGV